MRKMKMVLLKKLICFCLSLSLLVLPSLSFSKEAGSELRGKVFRSDGKTAIMGATVRAYHIESGKLYNSAPTDESGSYALTHLPYGYYDVAVETPEGLFVSTQVINVAPDSKLSLSFAISSFEEQPQEWWAGKEKPQIPALKKESSGIAKVLERKGGKAFWKSGKGIATILVGSAAVIGAIIASGGEEGSPH
ncbi:MAG: carboxypeptidase-like regulatory domain-containing protein [Acidobacteriota bacterium]